MEVAHIFPYALNKWPRKQAFGVLGFFLGTREVEACKNKVLGYVLWSMYMDIGATQCSPND